MEVPVLKGDRVTLRPVRERDIDDRLRLGRHGAFVHMCGGEPFDGVQYPERAVWENWYAAQQKEECAFVIEHEGRCIGSARFHRFSEADRSAAYAIGIFDPALYGQGLGKEVTKLMLTFGFETLRLHRIELKVLAYNQRAIRCYEACGFQQEGILRESAQIGGAWHADILMSILEQAFRAVYNV